MMFTRTLKCLGVASLLATVSLICCYGIEDDDE